MNPSMRLGDQKRHNEHNWTKTMKYLYFKLILITIFSLIATRSFAIGQISAINASPSTIKGGAKASVLKQVITCTLN